MKRFLYILCLLSISISPLLSQQQNANEAPGAGSDGSGLGNDTNYGLSPGNPSRSFDQATNPLNYPNPEDAKRTTISTSVTGLAQGYLYIDWETLGGRMFAFAIGMSLYASELSATRRAFDAANLDDNSFMNVGLMLGLSFYVQQQYAQGFVVQVKLGGGILTGSYAEDPTAAAANMLDFYGALMINIAYRLPTSLRGIYISPIVNLGANVVLPQGGYNSPLDVPSYFRINAHHDVLGVATPADITGSGTLLLFLHFGIGFDLTFIF